MTPQEVYNTMIERDHFTKWMGLELDEIREGYCRLHYTVKENMLNGFEQIHGGILFSASDSAFAFACNSHGIITVALDVSITFTNPAKAGDVLYVEAEELYLGNKTGLYNIRTTNAEGKLVCLFKGTAYRTGKEVQ
ncbi:hotdog fold thioesterase [Fluviicola sp.]|jgi:acyl-CoA thioesterase|uniref:hotdog fold thioesterase n=1 Tax=Fluviicola sp. TaxID=1917219 RepID=UPI002828AE4E|nr:hotdog fold thioesterase [Fluviicola sp.]MDR0801319.1 hotdog fold thioesterase [Fluviicola sp.]